MAYLQSRGFVHLFIVFIYSFIISDVVAYSDKCVFDWTTYDLDQEIPIVENCIYLKCSNISAYTNAVLDLLPMNGICGCQEIAKRAKRDALERDNELMLLKRSRRSLEHMKCHFNNKIYYFDEEITTTKERCLRVRCWYNGVIKFEVVEGCNCTNPCDDFDCFYGNCTVNGDGTPSCLCEEGYTGQHCDTPITLPCAEICRRGTCVNEICECWHPQLSPPACEDPCETLSCNFGYCDLDSNNMPRCFCPQPGMGPNCEGDLPCLVTCNEDFATCSMRTCECNPDLHIMGDACDIFYHENGTGTFFMPLIRTGRDEAIAYCEQHGWDLYTYNPSQDWSQVNFMNLMKDFIYEHYAYETLELWVMNDFDPALVTQEPFFLYNMYYDLQLNDLGGDCLTLASEMSFQVVLFENYPCFVQNYFVCYGENAK